MKQRDILALMDGIAPGIAASFAKAIAPVLARLETAEKRVAELETAQTLDMDSLAALVKTLAEQPKVADLVAAAVKDLTPAPLALEIDATKIKAVVDEAVAGITVDFEEVGRVVDERMSKAVEALPKPPTVEQVAALVKTPTAEEVAALVPAAVPGKDADPEIIRAMVDEAVAKIPPAEAGKSVTIDEIRPLVDQAVGAAFATVRVPEDGKDADPEVTAALVASEVQKAVAAIPPAEPGKDADPEVIKAMVDEAVAAIPRIVQDGKDATPEQIAEAVEKALATWERPKDGQSVTVEQLQPLVDEAVAKRVAEIPAPKDGVSVADVLIDQDGNLVSTFSDGRTKIAGHVVGKPGAPGENGADGFSVEKFRAECLYDGKRTFTFKFTQGDRVEEFPFKVPMVIDAGVWKEGTEYETGDAVTWGNSLWVVKAEITKEKPGTSDWRMQQKRPRDGKDGEAPKPLPKVSL